MTKLMDSVHRVKGPRAVLMREGVEVPQDRETEGVA
jgi:hypothetical protein